MLSKLPGWLARATVIAWILSALIRALGIEATAGHEVLLTVNGFAQAALLVAWLVVRKRIVARADPSEVTFTAAQYSLSLQPPANGGVAHLSAEAYDLLEWHHGVAYCVAGTVAGLAASIVLGTDVPLLLHTTLASLQLWRHPLVGLYLRRQPAVRPWNSFNPFL